MPGQTVLRDAIWGDIELGPRELALVDTPQFQRLRRVKQLGMTDLVFPGARHTRFEHSLGVFFLAGQVLDHLHTIDAPQPRPEEERAFLAAALLHDIGHYPFSHAIEELEVSEVRSHTDIARELILEAFAEPLAGVWDVDPVLVADLVAGPSEPLSETAELLRAAIDSGLDVDKLDYLTRDARGANVPYGLVDVQRLIGSLVVNDVDGRPVLTISEKGAASYQSLVFAKHLMFATVYWHHASRAAVVMLLRAVQEALRGGLIDAGDLERADDASLLSSLRAAGAPDLTATLSERLRDRRLYKRCLEITVDDERFGAWEEMWCRPAQRSVIEDGWANAAGLEQGAVLLDIPEPRQIVLDVPAEDMHGLTEADLDRYQTWVRRIRVFTSGPPDAVRGAVG